MSRHFDINDAYDYLDGLHSDAVSFEAHSVQCASCGLALADARSARGVWAKARAPELDPLSQARLDRRIHHAIAAEGVSAADEQPSGFGAGVWRGLVWAGAAFALAVGLYASYRLAIPDTTLPSPAVAQTSPPMETGAVVTAEVQPQRVMVAGATLTLERAASCQVVRSDERATVVALLSGTVTFDVAKRAPGQVFQVTSGDVTVTVHGTRFTVARDPDGTVVVSVDHGLVGVARHNEAEALLGPGEQIKRAPRQVSRSVESRTPSADEDVEAQADELDGTAGAAADGVDPIAAPAVAPEEPDVAAPAPVVARASKSRRHAKRARKARRAKKLAIEARTAKSEVPDARAEPAKTPTVEPTPAVNPEKHTPPAKIVFEPKPEAVVAVEKVRGADPGRDALKRIFKRLGKPSWSASIAQLHAWMRAHQGHSKRMAARYAVGYCHFKAGNVRRAQQIFSSLPARNPWIKKLGDFSNPPRPR